MIPDKINDDEFVNTAQIEHTDSQAVAGKLDVHAQTAREVAHQMGPLEALKTYPNAVFWSLMISMTVIMEGYDQILIGNFYAYPQFAAKFGQFTDDNGRPQLSASWQAGLSNASIVGCFIGSIANGSLVSRFGQKRVILAALVVMSAVIPLTFWAQNIYMLLVGQFLCGLPWGVFVTSSPAYASEVLPMCLRVYLTSWTNMCFIIGQLIASGVLAGLVDRPDQWSYRIPFALQWAWPLFLIPTLCYAPESPWHLVRVGKIDEARKSLERLQKKFGNKTTNATQHDSEAGSAAEKVNVDTALAEIVHTNNTEIEISWGTSYWDCFKGTERWRTEIACLAFAGQVLSGSTFCHNSTYFFSQVGLSTNDTYNLNVGGNAMSLVGTLVSWFAIMPYVGRRRTYLSGMTALFTILMIIGILNPWTDREGVAYTQASMTLVWTFTFQLTVGQLGWAIPSEIGSTRLRQKTICLARNSYYIVSIISQVVQPYFLNPSELNLRGYTGFFWGGTAFCVLIWAFFRLPESKGRTFEELDWLFANNTKTRKFRTAEVGAFTEPTSESKPTIKA